jgi:hypothetical protein
LLPYPGRRDRSIPVADMRIGITEFIHLYDCDLFRLINERNSNLGKIMPISRRLVYEITFLDSASDCQRKLTAEPNVEIEFRDRLRDIIETKRARLQPAHRKPGGPDTRCLPALPEPDVGPGRAGFPVVSIRSGH